MYVEWFVGVLLFFVVTIEIFGYSFLFTRLQSPFLKRLSLIFSLICLNFLYWQISLLSLAFKTTTFIHLFILVVGIVLFFLKRPHRPYLISPLFWKRSFFWLLPIIVWFSLKSIDAFIPHLHNSNNAFYETILRVKNLILFRDPISQSISPHFQKPYFWEYVFYHIQSLSHFFGSTFLKVHYRGLVAEQLFFLFWGMFFSIWSLGKILGKPYFYMLSWLVLCLLPEHLMQSWGFYALLSFAGNMAFTFLTEPVFKLKHKEHFLFKKLDQFPKSATMALSLLFLFIAKPHAHVLWQNLQYAATPLHEFLNLNSTDFYFAEWSNQNLTKAGTKLALAEMEEQASYFLRPLSNEISEASPLIVNLENATFPSQKAEVLCDFGYTHIFLSNHSAANESKLRSLSGIEMWLMTQKKLLLLKSDEASLFALPCTSAKEG